MHCRVLIGQTDPAAEASEQDLFQEVLDDDALEQLDLRHLRLDRLSIAPPSTSSFRQVVVFGLTRCTLTESLNPQPSTHDGVLWLMQCDRKTGSMCEGGLGKRRGGMGTGLC